MVAMSVWDKSRTKIVAIVGMTGSGKGTAVEYLSRKFGWPSVHFGNMVYDEVARRGLDIVRDENNVREDMRAKEGAAVFAKRAAKKARELFADGAKTVIFDGLYSWSEDKFLRAEFGEDIITVAIVAPKNLRYDRAVHRREERNGQLRKYSRANVRARDAREIEKIEKGGPIAFADYYVLNDGDVAKLQRQLDGIFA